MSSIQKHSERFASTPNINIQRSTFDRSHGNKTTFDPDIIVPIMVDEILPGDTFNVNLHGFGRLLTPLVPFMDNLYIDFFAFFVPNRLVWDNWEEFITGWNQQTKTQSTKTIPIAVSAPTGVGTLAEYFGIHEAEVHKTTNNMNVNALPFRGYNLIYNEWFRDQNLITPTTVDTSDGPDSTIYIPLKRMKRADYFTSALPWPQKGSDVTIPFANTIPITTTNEAIALRTFGSLTDRPLFALNDSAPANKVSVGGTGISPSENLTFGSVTGLQANSSTAAGTISELRTAYQIQIMLERDARGGSRYIEQLKSHFQVTVPDFRLQRPEFLAQGTWNVNTNPVTQTSESGSTPQGNLAAFSTVSGKMNFVHSFQEHGYLFILCSARADLNYQQGLNRMWSRQTRYDFYWPEFAHLTEQAILKKEILIVPHNTIPNTNDEVFAYQERYAEYKYKPSIITNRFNSSYSPNLEQWHLAQELASVPAFNASFIESNTPISRVLAVTPNNDAFYCDFWFDMKCTRPMPVYSIPGLSDHF